MTELPSDAFLLERFARHRDSQAFAQIVARYSGPIYATTRRILRDRTLAEEATQETFLRLLNHAGAVSRSLGGWLHRTATMVAIDMIRRDASRRSREAEYVAENPREVTAWDELSPAIDEALDELPDEERTLLVDHFLLGRSQADLAGELDVSPATMSRRMQQALEQLREALRKRGVLVAIAALSLWIGSQTAEAAPATLTRELGKMALLNSARHGVSEPGTREVLRGTVVATAVAIVAMMIIVALAVTWPEISGAARHMTATPGEPGRVVTTRSISVPAAAGQTNAATTIAFFQDPATYDGKTLRVVYADRHEEQLPLAEARRRVEAQTHEPIEETVRKANAATSRPAP